MTKSRNKAESLQSQPIMNGPILPKKLCKELRGRLTFTQQQLQIAFSTCRLLAIAVGCIYQVR